VTGIGSLTIWKKQEWHLYVICHGTGVFAQVLRQLIENPLSLDKEK
jgi:hypothetical protein